MTIKKGGHAHWCLRIRQLKWRPTQGHVRYRLKTPYRDGTTDGVFEPLDNIAGSDFEQPQAGPQGEGQDARRILAPVWQPGCRRHAST